MAPLKDLAERKNVAIVLFGHMNKNSGAKAMYRMIGSIGFIGIARISFLVTKDPDNPERRLILPIKANITKDNSGLA